MLKRFLGFYKNYEKNKSAFLLAVIKANKAKVCELYRWQFAAVLKRELFAIRELAKSQTKQKRLFTRND